MQVNAGCVQKQGFKGLGWYEVANFMDVNCFRDVLDFLHPHHIFEW